MATAKSKSATTSIKPICPRDIKVIDIIFAITTFPKAPGIIKSRTIVFPVFSRTTLIEASKKQENIRETAITLGKMKSTKLFLTYWFSTFTDNGAAIVSGSFAVCAATVP